MSRALSETWSDCEESGKGSGFCLGGPSVLRMSRAAEAEGTVPALLNEVDKADGAAVRITVAARTARRLGRLCRVTCEALTRQLAADARALLAALRAEQQACT